MRFHRHRWRSPRLGMRRDDVILKEYGGGMRRLEALKSGEIKEHRHQRAGPQSSPVRRASTRWSISSP